MSHGPNASGQPVILTLSGMETPDQDHWISKWQSKWRNCAAIDLGDVQRPSKTGWVNAISKAVDAADAPVILVARGLACMAVASWAGRKRPVGGPVVGAMLVAPPNVDCASADLRLIGFGPTPKALLPFPAVVVASRNDPRMDFAGAKMLAGYWGVHCVDGGNIGSAGATDALGDWDHGQHILNWLIDVAQPATYATGSEGNELSLGTNILPFVNQRAVSPVRDLSL